MVLSGAAVVKKSPEIELNSKLDCGVTEYLFTHNQNLRTKACHICSVKVHFHWETGRPLKMNRNCPN